MLEELTQNLNIKSTHLKVFIFTFFCIYLATFLQVLGVSVSTEFLSPSVSLPSLEETVRQKIENKHNSINLVPGKPFQAAGDFNKARSYLVVDLNNKQILVEKNSKFRLPIASLTKVMSAIIALDLANSNDLFTVKERASNTPPTRIGVVKNQKMYLDELLPALLLTSANDAAEVLRDGIDAKYGPGTFVRAMNQKARFLGLKETSFANPQGFDDPNNYSTAQDLALISLYALENYPLILEIAKKDYVFLPADSNHKQFDLYNWNGLVGVYPNIIGLKTGNTPDAGQTTIVISQRNGQKILAILLGVPGVIERDKWAADLLDLGFVQNSSILAAKVNKQQLKEKYGTWRFFK